MSRKRILSGALVLLILLQALLPALLALPIHSAFGTLLYDSLMSVTGDWQVKREAVILGQSTDGEMAYAHWKPNRSTMAYEAIVELGRNHVAGLTLGDADPETPYGFWAAGIDDATKTAWIRYYGETETVVLAQCKIGDPALSSGRYRLRVENHYADSMIVFIVNDEYFLYANTGNQKVSGYFGLLADGGGGWFENVNCWVDTPSVREMTANGTVVKDPSCYRKVLLGEDETTLRLHFEDVNDYLIARPLNGDPGLVIEVDEPSVTVRQITESFDLLLIARDGDFAFHYIIRVEASDSLQYREESRPQYHYTPKKGSMQEGGSIVYDQSDRQWHLFYPLQAAKQDPLGVDGIAHAVSPDLVHWTEQGVVWADDSILTFAVAADPENTSGFFGAGEEGRSRLVAICTKGDPARTNGIEMLYIAYSTDHGKTWQEPDAPGSESPDPVIDNSTLHYGYDFYASRLFFHDGKWMLLTGGTKVNLFTSPDLLHWSHAYNLAEGSKYPDLFPMTVEGTDIVKWIFSDAGKYYTVGELQEWGNEGRYRFVAESDRLPLLSGTIHGALQASVTASDGERQSYLLGYAKDTSNLYRWAGVLTLPYQLKLTEKGGNLLLSPELTPEANTLRAESAANVTEFYQAEQAKVILQNNPLVAFDLELCFTPLAKEVRLEFMSDGIYSTALVYDAVKDRLRLIRRESCNKEGKEQGDLYSTVLADLSPDGEGKVWIRILSDGNLLEVLDREGRPLLSALVYPEPGAVGWDCSTSEIVMFNDLGTNWDVVEYHSLRLWRMKSVWRDGETVLPQPGIYYHYDRYDEPRSSISKEDPTYLLTIVAYVVGENGLRRNNVKWTAPTTSSKDSAGILQYNQENKIRYRITKMNRTLLLTVTDEMGLYAEELEVQSTAPAYQSNLSGLAGQYWETGQFGLNNTGPVEYMPLVSPIEVSGAFSLRCVFQSLGEQDSLGLAFGIPNTAANRHPEGWYGLTLSRIGGTGEHPLLTFFQYDTATGQPTVLEKYYLKSSNERQWKLKVNYNGDGKLQITVNGEAYFTTTVQMEQLSAGYLGLLAVEGYGGFSEVVYQDIPDSIPNLPLGPDDPMDLPGDHPFGDDSQRGSGNSVIWASIVAIVLGVIGLCTVSAVVWKKRRQELLAAQPGKIDYFENQDKLPPRLH